MQGVPRWRRGTGLLPTLVKVSVAGLPLLCQPNLTHAASAISAAWANTGEDKVTRDELRATHGVNVHNSVWDGRTISQFGARNEVVAFNLILEAGEKRAENVSVSFARLDGPGGASIFSDPSSRNVFDWTRRNIELFYVRYLQIKGLSRVTWDTYDERHVPQRMRRSDKGGNWNTRPDHDKYYPEIAIPMEAVPTFAIEARANQSVWVDIYIPKSTPPGAYLGTLTVRQRNVAVSVVPVRLTVYDFSLPDIPSAKTMVYYSVSNVNQRYFGTTSVEPRSPLYAKSQLIRDRHYLTAHRHRISLIEDSPGSCDSAEDRPCPEFIPRLDGSLFTSDKGYDGPGVGVGNGIYSIGTYGAWSWKKEGPVAMRHHSDAWVSWFTRFAPATSFFLYLIDESKDVAQIQTWAQWIAANPGPGRLLKSMATIPLPVAASQAPDLEIPTSAVGVGIASEWQVAADQYTTDSRKRFFMYNGKRPNSGSFATEDDGIALRELAWGQFKKHINRWFYWESTYYDNFQGGMGQTNVFQTAQTFGKRSVVDPQFGETGWNYTNGDGVLFYPGTDRLNPKDSYGIEGPLVSLRLKCWRRGLQDVDYLNLAFATDPKAVQDLVERLVPKVLWEYGVDNLRDPTYVHSDISWSANPDVWEAARAQLAEIILKPKAQR